MPTIRWPWAEVHPPPVQKRDGGHTEPQRNHVILENLQEKLESFPAPLLAITAFAVGSVTTVAATLAYTRYGRRLKNGEWITPDVFAKKRWIKGVVTAVGDADNFRLYHTPSLGWQWPLKVRRIPADPKDLRDQTISIRIAGVDAPEGAHFGRPAQLYASESLAWLRKTILGKTVYCQLLRRDQYSRTVAIVVIPSRVFPKAFGFGRNLSLEMLRAGWATTYEQAGAEYGEWGKVKFLRLEAEAKAARRGIWKDGVDGETPAQYKRRYANAGSSEEAEARKPKSKQLERRSPRSWQDVLAMVLYTDVKSSQVHSSRPKK